jgi:hypothetical protein
MRKIGLVLSVALTLCTGTLNARAHGGGCGGCFFWPFMAFGLGLALASSSQANTVSYYPLYVSPPGPVYAPQTPPAEPASPSAPVATSWVPSTPGSGKWVLDSQPYSYLPARAFAAHSTVAPAATVVVVTNSPGGVPVHIVSHLVAGGL